MQYQWILDVIGDLRDFARANGMAGLADHLEGTSMVAASDIARATGTAEPSVADLFRTPRRPRDVPAREPS